ncbi:transcriptional regulator, XRE family [Delftia acidovorans SPH-1]|uniref:Transcriptional regulator, XRE family n=1 Tax=Delftia acidovorans (strain DSM 14801 / SPH-1) TaxID=398578 RepID=A9C1N0_DELAS|nr:MULTISPECIES: helix-turn-helix transcriptional regulator [Delftia]MBA4002641.1 transcriptional regulator [Delftia sp.]MDA1813232.1 helix-turn-helix domain-containing protein [Bacillus cereus]OLE94474.1 MAG: transcriptional regulator [Delftia sp. 13_1_40CM_3_66_6]TMJ00435.1 MAG: helix-turn-helix domain-containing protein [Alphaproteobacteria bacterium]HLB76302.1 helix-turn-helix domain-containing protein [Candidatus Dormibacteraeota bacterium]
MDHLLQLPDQLALHLKSLRKAAGVSQAQLAQRLGVSQSRVAAIERDPAAISVRQLMEILQLLDADLLMRPRADAVASPASAPMSVPAPAALRVAEPAPQPYAGDNVPRKPADRPVAFKPQALPPHWQDRKPKGSW